MKITQTTIIYAVAAVTIVLLVLRIFQNKIVDALSERFPTLKKYQAKPVSRELFKAVSIALGIFVLMLANPGTKIGIAQILLGMLLILAGIGIL